MQNHRNELINEINQTKDERDLFSKSSKIEDHIRQNTENAELILKVIKTKLSLFKKKRKC